MKKKKIAYNSVMLDVPIDSSVVISPKPKKKKQFKTLGKYDVPDDNVPLVPGVVEDAKIRDIFDGAKTPDPNFITVSYDWSGSYNKPQTTKLEKSKAEELNIKELVPRDILEKAIKELPFNSINDASDFVRYNGQEYSSLLVKMRLLTTLASISRNMFEHEDWACKAMKKILGVSKREDLSVEEEF
jgi:hypothetical protein